MNIWLSSHVDYDVPEKVLLRIFDDRGVDGNSSSAIVTQKQKDLCLADLYMWLAGSSTSSTGEYESDGGWQHQKSAKNVFDRGYFRALAERLYAKYDEATSSVGKIVIKDLY